LIPSWTSAYDRINPIEEPIEPGSDYPLLTNETPGMVIVLTYQQIRARGYRSLYEILRDLPGFSTRGGFGQNFVKMNMDGDVSQNNETFLLYVDGVREQDLWRHSTWLAFQYPVYFIKNITIFYGPAATRFGANAVSGVVFIDTKKAEDLADGYGEISLTKDVRNNMWALDFMTGHSYSKRSHPKLAKSLFSWYVRGRFYFSDERNSDYDKLWNPSFWNNPPSDFRYAYNLSQSQRYFDSVVEQFRNDYYRAYKKAFDNPNDPAINNAVDIYRNRLLRSFIEDPANSGQFALNDPNKRAIYRNQNISFSAETGLRFDNWFLRFFLWSTGTGEGLNYLPHYAQTNAQSWVRNLSISLHHLKSELWSSGVGEKAQVIYFNLSIVYQRHEVPGDSHVIRFLPETRTFREEITDSMGIRQKPYCTDIENGQNEVDCTWRDYAWRPTYTYLISNSFRAEPKLDFRLLNGHLNLSVGFNTGFAFIQGPPATSNRPDPETYAQINIEQGAGNQFEHIYLTGFFQSEINLASWLIANLGVRSDWELVRGDLGIIPNCDRSLMPCYRYSAPLIGRASLITKLLDNKFQARLSYGYAFLSPSNWELFGNASGDTIFTSPRSTLDRTLDARSLLPQDKHSVELNVYANIASRVFFTLSFFHHWFNNVASLVILSDRPQETRNINIGHQYTLGTRLYSMIRVASWMQINANLAILLPRIHVFNLEDPKQNPLRLLDIPMLQANLILDFRSAPQDVSHFFGSIRTNLVTGRQATIFQQLQNGQLRLAPDLPSTNFYAILHLSAGFLWRTPENWPFQSLSISASIENVLSLFYNDLGIRTALEPVYTSLIPQPGINAFFNLALSF
jgi:hypothetical protein